MVGFMVNTGQKQDELDKKINSQVKVEKLYQIIYKTKNECSIFVEA